MRERDRYRLVLDPITGKEKYVPVSRFRTRRPRKRIPLWVTDVILGLFFLSAIFALASIGFYFVIKILRGF